jgi:rubrerythrin
MKRKEQKRLRKLVKELTDLVHPIIEPRVVNFGYDFARNPVIVSICPICGTVMAVNDNFEICWNCGIQLHRRRND